MSIEIRNKIEKLFELSPFSAKEFAFECAEKIIDPYPTRLYPNNLIRIIKLFFEYKANKGQLKEAEILARQNLVMWPDEGWDAEQTVLLTANLLLAEENTQPVVLLNMIFEISENLLRTREEISWQRDILTDKIELMRKLLKAFKDQQELF